jgi:hypothetical protein
MQGPPTMHYVCDPANDEGGAWSLHMEDVPHPFASMVQAGVVCKINTDGPLDAYPVLSLCWPMTSSLHEMRAWQQCLR